MVEQLAVNQWVAGSSPATGARQGILKNQPCFRLAASRLGSQIAQIYEILYLYYYLYYNLY